MPPLPRSSFSSGLLGCSVAIVSIAVFGFWAGSASAEPPASVIQDGAPLAKSSTLAALAPFSHARRASAVAWSPDNELFIATRFGATRQLHRVDFAGGARTQLTFFEEPVGSVTGGATGLVMQRDTGGSETYQLHFSRDGVDWVPIAANGRNGGVRWDGSGDRLAWYSTARNGTDWDIHVATAAELIESEGIPSETSAVVRAAGTGWIPEDFSPDGKRLIVTRYLSVNESSAWEIDLASGARTAILSKVAIDKVRYAADGSVLLTSDRGGEFVHLQRALGGGAFQDLTPDLQWDVDSFEVSHAAQLLVWSENLDGYSRLQLRRWPDLAEIPIQGLPRGVTMGRLLFSPDGSRLAVSISSPTVPGDVWVVDTQSGEAHRWTTSELGGLDPDSLVNANVVRYPTFDHSGGQRREIPALVYAPKGPGPHPVLIDIHGGPESQARPWFSSRTQFLVRQLGIAVIRPNVRGSRGYGRSWLLLDNGRRREDSVRDIGALLDWIATQPQFDAGRVAVTGGSYGGYMTLASLVHFGDRLRAGAEAVGISNFVTFLTNTRGYRRDLRRREYGDERDPAMRKFLESISPLNHAGKIQKPLLVAQGRNDPRVPESESDQVVKRVRAAGTEVWYLVMTNEGHGFRRKENSDYYNATLADFLSAHLLAEP